MAIEFFQSLTNGGVSCVLGKPLSRAFLKHMTCSPLLWQPKKLWLPQRRMIEFFLVSTRLATEIFLVTTRLTTEIGFWLPFVIGAT